MQGYDQVDELLMFVDELQILKTPSHTLKKCKFCKYCRNCCKVKGKCQKEIKLPTEKLEVEKIVVKLSSEILNSISLENFFLLSHKCCGKNQQPLFPPYLSLSLFDVKRSKQIYETSHK